MILKLISTITIFYNYYFVCSQLYYFMYIFFRKLKKLRNKMKLLSVYQNLTNQLHQQIIHLSSFPQHLSFLVINLLQVYLIRLQIKPPFLVPNLFLEEVFLSTPKLMMLSLRTYLVNLLLSLLVHHSLVHFLLVDRF